MSTQFLGEIRMFGYTFAPRGWMDCNGSLLAISQYDALFSLLGTTYGGDGQSTFALPDLRGRLPISQGQGPGLSNYVIGQVAGAETVTVLSTQMPAHSHTAVATSASANVGSPGTTVLPGAISSDTLYTNDVTNLVPNVMAASSVSLAGGSAPHENCMPTLTVRYCIAVEGIYPQQN